MHRSLSTANLLVLCLATVLIARGDLWAQVYKWQDGNGVVHYSTKPTNGQAAPANLPRITRADVKLPTGNLQSCAKHGGLDCQAGADTDGSVICVDGFKDATTRYRFHCNSPKLAVSEVNRDPDGTYKVVVRNSNAVAAGKVAVFFERPDGKEVPLDGPGDVKPFGLAEYKLDKADSEGLVEKPLTTNFRLVCSNCP